jgi:hypothetical protein
LIHIGVEFDPDAVHLEVFEKPEVTDINLKKIVSVVVSKIITVIILSYKY